MLVCGDSLFYADAWGKVTARWASTGERLWEAQRLKAGQGAIVVADSVLLVGSADGWLAELRQWESGCTAARPYSLRQIEECGRSGWAAVARSSLEGCGAEREPAEDDREMDGTR